jgi:hypothetical protein
MPTISKGSELLTLINVFAVEPVNQQELVELLVNATRTSVRHVQGFVSASLHRSLDGTKVAMYAQWRRTITRCDAIRPPLHTWKRPSRSRGSSSGCTKWSRPLTRQPPNPRMQPTSASGLSSAPPPADGGRRDVRLMHA